MQRKYIGRILAVIGLVLLLSSVLTFLIGAPTMAVGKVALALVLFVVYAVTNFGDLGNSATSKGTFFYLVSALSAVAVAGLLVAANYIAAKHPKTWDLTKNQIHTLSPDTVKTLEGLSQEVTAYGFYRGGEGGYAALNELFGKYAARSKNFKYEFVDPLKDPVKAQQFGVREGGPRVVVKQGATESRFQDLNEEALTNAIVKVTHASAKKIYFVTGHGEADADDSGPAGYSEVKKRMENEGLKAEKINLATATTIPQNAQALVIAGPSKPFHPGEADVVRKYLDAGGKAFIMVEPQVPNGLDDLLRAYNVEADDALVIDPISRLFGTSEAFPVVQNYNAQSEITKDFRLNTVFPTARPLTLLHEDPSAVAQPLALSMASAWGELDPQGGEVKRDENEKGGPFPLVATVTKATASAENKRSDEARLVVAGDRDFATNKFRTASGNEDFFLNCLNWLSEQTDRITIRPRMRDASRLYLTDTQQASIFFLAIDVLPVTLLVIGLVVWVTRRSK